MRKGEYIASDHQGDVLGTSWRMIHAGGIMLKLPNQLSDPKANEIVKTFVNERLINLMEFNREGITER